MPARLSPVAAWLLLALACCACTPRATPTGDTAPGDALPGTSAPAPGATAAAETASVQPYSVRVTFLDSVVYAGATHFFFERANGERFRVVESNDAGEIRIRNSAMLLDPNPDEGPPGPNPAFVGRQVTLHYDDHDRVVSVMPAYE